MKANIPNPGRLNITGNGPKSDQEIFSSVLKQWGQKLGYCSVVAAVPAVLAANLPVSRSVEAKKPQAKVIGRGARNLAKLNLDLNKRALLKRQSEFRLPHQNANDGNLAPLGGFDGCPGRAIPAGSYTAAAPFVDSGDTTGANDTIKTVYVYCAYSYYNVFGPDHIYSFTMSARGPNAQIQISTSSTSRPIAYVLPDVTQCPAGTGNQGVFLYCDWSARTGTINMSHLPLNTPLYLVVDSFAPDDAGPYTIRMQDVTIVSPPSCSLPNHIDCSDFFVRQHYRDFLFREPDPEGLAFWTNQITSCGEDQKCIEVQRINNSGSFFLSIEFQETGYFVYRLYKAAYGDIQGSPVPLRFNEFLPDTQTIGRNVIVNQAGWETALETNKRNFALEFVWRGRFRLAHDTSLSPEAFVDRLFANAGVTPSSSERSAAIAEFGGAGNSADEGARARALRRVAENSLLTQVEFNRAFVLMQYFGYLQRNPNDAPDGNFAGYNFWLDKLNQFNGDFHQAEMVKAFISSLEYRRRFAS